MSRTLQRTTAALCAALLLSACTGGGGSPGAAGTAGMLATLRTIAASCDGPVHGYVALDASGTARDAALLDERLDVVKDLAHRIVACTGHLRVVAFTSSQTDTVELLDVEFPALHGTLNSRLLRQGRELEGLGSAVRSAATEAESRLTGDGSDVLGQLTLIEQYKQQRGTGAVDAVVLTDGVQTEGPLGLVVNSAAFDQRVALDAAGRVVIPALTERDRLSFIGLGRVVGEQPPTAYTRALTEFYGALCARTSAHCRVVTDYTKES